MSGNTLRTIADLIRRDHDKHDPDHKFWAALADLLDAAAKTHKPERALPDGPYAKAFAVALNYRPLPPPEPPLTKDEVRALIYTDNPHGETL